MSPTTHIQTMSEVVELTFQVTFNYYPGYPGNFYEPPEGPEVEITKMELSSEAIDGSVTYLSIPLEFLSESLIEHFQEQLEESDPNDFFLEREED